LGQQWGEQQQGNEKVAKSQGVETWFPPEKENVRRVKQGSGRAGEFSTEKKKRNAKTRKTAPQKHKNEGQKTPCQQKPSGRNMIEAAGSCFQS